MNEEEVHDKSASSDQWQGQRLDGGDDSPVLSEYSSCGESEFERYCSANSAMGTPSLCSSFGTFHECLDSDLGSVRSFGLGEDGVLENFSLEGKFEKSSEDRRLGVTKKGLNSYDYAERSSSWEAVQGDGNDDPLYRVGNVSTIPNVASLNTEEDSKPQRDNGCSNALLTDGNVTDRSIVEDGTSSRFEHSEDEDSMFEYGTDGEPKAGSYGGRNGQVHQESKAENGNPLFISSSIAFGSEDWEDFLQVQETGESTLDSLTFGDFQQCKEQNIEPESILPISTTSTPVCFPGHDELNQREDATRVPVLDDPAQDHDNSGQCLDIEGDILEKESDIPTPNSSSIIGLSSISSERQHQYVATEEKIILDDVLESPEMTKLCLDPLSDVTTDKFCSPLLEAGEDKIPEFVGEYKHGPNLPPSLSEDNTRKTLKGSSVSTDLFEDHPTPTKGETLVLNEYYNEVVLDMEEILLDSSGSPGVRFNQNNRTFQPQLSLPPRDGGPTASTSGTNDSYPVGRHKQRIDGVEVVGARQKQGDVSLSERLVGVKEHTVYKLRVWSGNNQWEVERRYRDFFTLYHRLKSFYSDQGLILPAPWSSVERESRKIFGNVSPDVIAERSALIQECLRSILHPRSPSNPPNALISFLSSQNTLPSSPISSTTWLGWSSSFTSGKDSENMSTLGKTISLIVENIPHKPTKQLLEMQHYICAGCHKYFNEGRTGMQEFVQTFGWGKPRLCEYTGQLFCSSCHTNDTAVLPAKVLHHWDFTQYLVSQMAKSYLDSIHDQPMLCVSAVNPLLFSKVPALLHIMGVRKKIGAMVPYVRCPFRRSIHKGLRARRYLVESNDFFALKDLIDLSKGAFSALPVMVETVRIKILEHITEQCLVCCDVGVPCGARQACDDPSSLIFPFQEGEVEKCRSCESVFHKHCFKNIKICPCQAYLKVAETMGPTKTVTRDGYADDGTLHLFGKNSDLKSPMEFISGLFSKARIGKMMGSKENDSTVILMGSLPSTSL